MAIEETDMMEAQKGDSPPGLPPPLPQPGILRRSLAWFQEEGPWWLCSFVFHLVLVCSLALVGGRAVEAVAEKAPSFEEAEVEIPKDVPKEITQFDVGQTPEDPSELSTETLTLEKPAQIAQDADKIDDNPVYEPRGGGVVPASTQPNVGGLGGFDIKGVGAGPAFKGKGGVGIGVGTGIHAGTGGSGSGFGGRGSGSREAMLASGGGTKQSERAVAGALNWLARHQSSNGSWNLQAYKSRCKDATCTGPGVGPRPAAATAMGLLPFLAAGQTHESKGPYQKIISAGIYFLIHNQKNDGDLTMGGSMYDHGLAAIALCECYGMSGDKRLQKPAQAALNFIMDSQDPKGGGWRYTPHEPGDTSVVGWQIMALKSGQMAYLTVNPAVFEKAKEFLKSVSSGYHGGRFSYMPDNPVVGAGDHATTAVGLLCHQYMNMPRTELPMVEGTAYLMNNLPGPDVHDLYYWYYATQVMHNQPGPEWDSWNRKMRRLLIDTQSKDGCAAGSWDPNLPKADVWGTHGGRLMTTSLSALTLEVYYRYLPLYKLDKQGGGAPEEKKGKEEPVEKNPK